MKKHSLILSFSIISCFLLFSIEQIFHATYIIKTLSKWVLFVILPICYLGFFNRKSIQTIFMIKKGNRKSLWLGFAFGMSAFLILLISFYLCRHFIDLNNISKQLSKTNVKPSNFIYIGAYITFCNSFIEEFFFRGFIFFQLYSMGYKKTAFIVSSLLFSLYHVGIFLTWFSFGIFLLIVFSLFLVGLFFCWLNSKSNNFYNSWMVHLFADSAIIIIGLFMFHIL